MNFEGFDKEVGVLLEEEWVRYVDLEKEVCDFINKVKMLES